MKKLYTIVCLIFLILGFGSELDAQTVIAYDDYDTITSLENKYIDVLLNDIVNDPDVKIGIISVGNGLAFSMGEYDSLVYRPYQRFVNHVYSKDTIVYCLYKGDYPFGTVDTLSVAKVYLEVDSVIFMGRGYCLDVNNYKVPVDAKWNLSGSMFYSGSTWEPTIEIPKGSGRSTIFSAGPWIGGQTSYLQEIGEDFRIGCSDSWYSRDEIIWWNGPVCLDANNYQLDSYKNKWDKIWGITKEEVLNHIENYDKPDYVMPWAIENWPANGDSDLGQSQVLAPFQDIDGDLIYEPNEGDFPIVFGDQAIYAIFNDANHDPGMCGAIFPGLGTLEVHCMIFAFKDSENEYFNNTFFARYQIFNRPTSGFTYDIDSAYLSMWTDFDIGHPFDDYSGCDVSQGSYFGYNGDSIDGDSSNMQHFGLLPPAQGVLMLKGPKLEDDGIDNPAFDIQSGNNCGYGINGFGFGDDSVDNEHMGMTNFMAFSDGYYGSLSSGYTREERYGHLRSYWRDGQSLNYGSNGYFSDGIECKFAFPGDSDPCFWGTNGIDPQYTAPNGSTSWTEMNEMNDDGDRQGIGSMGPFTFEANTMEEMFVAFVYARSEDESDPYSLNILKESMDSIKKAFEQNVGPKGEPIVFDSIDLKKGTEPTVEKSVYFYPNPTKDGISFNTSIFKEAINYEVYDISGKLIGKGIIEDPSSGLSVQALRNGLYFIKMYSGNISVTKKILKY